MVPLMVVALRMSVPAIIGMLPSSANTIIVHMPTTIARGPGLRPASIGTSWPMDLATDANVESSVEPAAMIITTVISR